MFALDLFVLTLLKGIFFILNSLPLNFRLLLVEKVIRIIAFLNPSFKKISSTNLAIVFPNYTENQRNKIYEKSFSNVARLIIDFARLEYLDDKWIKENVELDLNFFKSIAGKGESGEKAVLYATGHIGSFELMAHAVAKSGFPVSFIARNFTLPKTDAWWIGIREKSGNKVIDRKGAVALLLKRLSDGKDCALLFDQNVKRNHAIFTDWFGQKAATTFALAFAALKAESKLVIVSVRYTEYGKYKIVAEECNCRDIYDNHELTQDEKLFEITQRASNLFQKHILAYPEGWFWMHRRWKTRPEGEKETLYR